MTEDEARTKWCPMTRYDSGSEGNGCNKPLNYIGEHSAYCIASDCACWVWDFDEYVYNVGMVEKAKSKTDGHCGLIQRG